jgi:hypothetical protein
MRKLKRTLGVLAIALSMLSMAPLLTTKATEADPVAAADQCFFCRCSNGKCVCVQIVCPT